MNFRSYGCTLSAADERDHLELVAGCEHRGCVLRARHDLAVAFDRDPSIAEPELHDQRGHRGAHRDAAALTVDDDVDLVGHRRGSYHVDRGDLPQAITYRVLSMSQRCTTEGRVTTTTFESRYCTNL